MSGEVFLTLDQDVCMGAGYCAKTNPRLFRLTGEGIAELRGENLESRVNLRNDEDIAAAHQCASVCPSGAIAVTEGVTGLH
jgi:ferredoxin